MLKESSLTPEYERSLESFNAMMRIAERKGKRISKTAMDYLSGIVRGQHPHITLDEIETERQYPQEMKKLARPLDHVVAGFVDKPPCERSRGADSLGANSTDG